jgi:hypothetical protein
MEHASKTDSRKAAGFKKVKAAIKKRDISEVSWTLLDVCIDELEESGSTTLGKTALMELIRVISVQKNADGMASRMEKVEELKEWLRKAA